MNSETTVEVHRSVSVPLAPRRAFELFTTRMTEFWPPEHSIGSVPIAEVVLEPLVGGRWYERGEDGSECDWGRVAQWEPVTRVVLIWQINQQWQFDPELETEVEVTFTEKPEGRTRLDLTHRHLERYGDATESMLAVFDSPGGWGGTLARFLAASEGAGPR